MKQLWLFGSILLFCTFQSASLYAQDSTEEKTSYLKYEVSYLSDNVYLGRKDSVKVPYLSPTIGYYHKSGLFATASASYLPTESRVDAYTISGGYSFTKKKWEGEFSVEKYFYSAQSYNVNSEVKGDAAASVGYDAGPIKTTLAGTLNFGTTTDYAASLTLEHSFSVFDESDITPTFTVNASTQNSYNDYYKKRRYAKTRKGKIVPYTITANALNVNQFKIMDYEASVPFNYVVHKFTFNLTPTVAIPVNPNMIAYNIKSGTGPGLNKVITAKVGTCFFWSLGVSFKL